MVLIWKFSIGFCADVHRKKNEITNQDKYKTRWNWCLQTDDAHPATVYRCAVPLLYLSI